MDRKAEVIVGGRLAPEVGAVLLKALDAAREALYVSSETPASAGIDPAPRANDIRCSSTWTLGCWPTPTPRPVRPRGRRPRFRGDVATSGLRRHPAGHAPLGYSDRSTVSTNHRAVRSSWASPWRGPTSCTPSGKPLAPRRSGRLRAGMPDSVHSAQKVGSPVECRPGGAVPEAVGVRIAS